MRYPVKLKDFARVEVTYDGWLFHDKPKWSVLEKNFRRVRRHYRKWIVGKTVGKLWIWRVRDRNWEWLKWKLSFEKGWWNKCRRLIKGQKI